MTDAALARFGEAYARHRAAEGRGHVGDDLLSLPYLTRGPLATQWAVRASSFQALMRHIVRPETKRLGRPLAFTDLGAGNGWLSYRTALEGHHATALDIRDGRIAAIYIVRNPDKLIRVATALHTGQAVARG